MNAFIRWAHRCCLVVQSGAAIGWAFAYANNQSGVALFNFIWCIAFAAYSFHVLRGERKGMRA